MAHYLLTDIGSTFTKAALVDASSRTLVATACAPTTIDTDVNEGFDAACAHLGTDVPGTATVLACSSAAGGLKIAAVGLVPELTSHAARSAALGAGGKVVATFSYRLNDSDMERLEQAAVDIVLLAGGTDGGNTKYIVENARRLARSLKNTAVICAGNRDAEDELRRIFEGRDDVFYAGNVMPVFGELSLDGARETIRRVFLERIVESKGLHRLQSRARIVMPTPEAVLKAVSLLSSGTGTEQGLGELVLVDMGGATTDVYSCCDGAPGGPGVARKGLKEPYELRTVEADIGLSHTLEYLLEQLDSSEMSVDAHDVDAWKSGIRSDWSHCPASDGEQRVVEEVARLGCRLAVGRHAGSLEETFTPEGRLYIQTGKDLGGVKYLIGSGGAVSRSAHPEAILRSLLREEGSMSLQPVSPGFMVDSSYIMWAMGLLSEDEPSCALEMMKTHLHRIEG